MQNPGRFKLCRFSRVRKRAGLGRVRRLGGDDRSRCPCGCGEGEGFEVSGGCGVERGDAHDVVDGADEEPRGLASFSAFVAELGCTVDGFGPAEGFFAPFADPQADVMSRMADGALSGQRGMSKPVPSKV